MHTYPRKLSSYDWATKIERNEYTAARCGWYVFEHPEHPDMHPMLIVCRLGDRTHAFMTPDWGTLSQATWDELYRHAAPSKVGHWWPDGTQVTVEDFEL